MRVATTKIFLDLDLDLHLDSRSRIYKIVPFKGYGTAVAPKCRGSNYSGSAALFTTFKEVRLPSCFRLGVHNTKSMGPLFLQSLKRPFPFLCILYSLVRIGLSILSRKPVRIFPDALWRFSTAAIEREIETGSTSWRYGLSEFGLFKKLSLPF